jgi:hypothetical protein
MFTYAKKKRALLIKTIGRIIFFFPTRPVGLEPIRKHVQEVIKYLFTQNYRMDQNDGVKAMIDYQLRCLEEENVNGHILDIQNLKFYDISSWTDRFHHNLQKVTMKHLFNARISEVCAQLTVHCEWNVPDLGSFDVATLIEHLFIHFMYNREGNSEIFPVTLYGKVGDDAKDSYAKYCEKINLPINLAKSKTFYKLGSVAEFCSRTAIDGYDVSRVSPNVINRSLDLRSIPQLLSVCSQRGIILKPRSFPTLQHLLKKSRTNGEEKYI